MLMALRSRKEGEMASKAGSKAKVPSDKKMHPGKTKEKMPFAKANGKANNPKGKKVQYATTTDR
jgi:hypothetical protein